MGKNEISQLERDELLVFLQNHSNLRTGQDQIVWSIFGAFWGTNALLLISLFSVGDQWKFEIVGIIISIIGIFISLIWTSIQIRAINRVQMHEDSMKFVEKKALIIPDELCTYSIPPRQSEHIPKIAKKILKWIGLKKVKVRQIMVWCSLIVLLLWVLSLTCFICLLI